MTKFPEMSATFRVFKLMLSVILAFLFMTHVLAATFLVTKLFGFEDAVSQLTLVSLKEKHTEKYSGMPLKSQSRDLGISGMQLKRFPAGFKNSTKEGATSSGKATEAPPDDEILEKIGDLINESAVIFIGLVGVCFESWLLAVTFSFISSVSDLVAVAVCYVADNDKNGLGRLDIFLISSWLVIDLLVFLFALIVRKRVNNWKREINQNKFNKTQL